MADGCQSLPNSRRRRIDGRRKLLFFFVVINNSSSLVIHLCCFGLLSGSISCFSAAAKCLAVEGLFKGGDSS